MEVPLEIAYRDVEKTEEIDNLIRNRAAGLETLCDYLTSCRVAVEKPQKSQRSGQPYRVRIQLRVPPGHELVVSEDPGEGEMHTELPTVIRNAFDSALRQLKKLVEQQRGEVKKHPEQQLEAVVEKIFPAKGYGFIKTIDNRQIYFHRNSVLHDDFERLEVGTGVRFTEKEGLEGPQASSVQIVDKPGSRR